jgi:tellurite resistance protein TehA-like permease
LAEVFVAFAGFTGIVATLGQRSEGKWRPVDAIRFRALLEASLAGLVFSVTPFGFHYFGVAEAITWSFGSALLAVYVISFLFRIIRKQKRLRTTEDPNFVPGVRLVLVTLAIPVVATQLLNAIGAGLQHTFSGFLLGLIFLLILCCAMFVLLLGFVRVEA